MPAYDARCFLKGLEVLSGRRITTSAFFVVGHSGDIIDDILTIDLSQDFFQLVWKCYSQRKTSQNSLKIIKLTKKIENFRKFLKFVKKFLITLEKNKNF
jgi:hypothetical protein